MGFLALPTADLRFEVCYSHTGVQEPGCYLHSTATDITNLARPSRTETQRAICQPPTSSRSQHSASTVALHTQHPHPHALKKGLEMFKGF